MPLVPLMLVTAGAFALAALALARAATPRREWLVAALLAALAAEVGLVWSSERERRTESLQALAAVVPTQGRADQGYVSSDACRACHPGPYASWRRSFHRTMTTLATPENVHAPWGGVTLENRGRAYRLSRRADEYWVELTDPDWERGERLAGRDPDAAKQPPRVQRRVVMVTGSHHMQTYWVESRHGNEVFNLPFVYLHEQARFVPREEVFLRPPQAPRFFAMWNNSCIECHSTAGQVGFDLQRELFRSSVAELGIACEACHGPAALHVEQNRNPLRRYGLHLGGGPDATIVQPSRLAQGASAAVCGQCHGVSLPDELEWLRQGHSFRPGQELQASRFLVRPASDPGSAQLRELHARDPSALPSRFWNDGMVRVSGRELNAMIESACYRGGQLTCLSCHSMHASEPDDQLAHAAAGDRACLQCHDERYGGARLAAHTRHAPASDGSRCVNCHMPHTTYGLLKAIRSHWIDSPRVATTLRTGRPNACNLCHLDKPLGWTAERLRDWYGQQPPALDEEQVRVSAALLQLLRGEAGQRALAAWSFGWAPAQRVSGSGWLLPYLAHLLEDPYAAVRYVAGRALRTLPESTGVAYDFLDPPERRAAARRALLDAWFDLPEAHVDRKGEAVLIDAGGNPMNATIAKLAGRRDDRPVFLNE